MAFSIECHSRVKASAKELAKLPSNHCPTANTEELIMGKKSVAES